MRSDDQMQADCNHVDKIERGVSRLMFALKDMGFQWKTGSFLPEYGRPYLIWRNGPYAEGTHAPKITNINDCVDQALGMFKAARDVASFIVWRTPPQIEATTELDTGDIRYKLYFRWHFLADAPADYVKDSKMDDDLPSDVEGFPMPADLVADKRVRDQVNMEKQKHLQAEMQARESAMATQEQQFVNQGNALTGSLYGGVTDAALRAQCLQSAMQFCGSSGDTQKLITMAAAFYKFIKDGPTNLTAVK